MSRESTQEIKQEVNNEYSVSVDQLKEDKIIPPDNKPELLEASGDPNESCYRLENSKSFNDDIIQGAVARTSDYCDSDELIAKLLQEQFNTELKQDKKKSSIKLHDLPIAYEKYELKDQKEQNLEGEDEYDDNYPQDPASDEWDDYDTDSKPDSVLKTKLKFGRDLNECPVRNLRDQKHADNSIKFGIDEEANLLLTELIKTRFLKGVNSKIRAGQKSVVLHADGYHGAREYAVKIFKTNLSDQEKLERYNNLKSDYRFKERVVKHNGRLFANMTAEKEMLNIQRLHNAGIPCAHVLLQKERILVMSFIGENQTPAPTLKFARISQTLLMTAYKQIIQNMRTMYRKADLVHGNLNEHNILWYDGKCWFTGLAQATHKTHPSALKMLISDCNNVVSYFGRCGLRNLKTKEELFEYITTSQGPEVLTQ